jgi:hypothetical protein
MHYATADMTDFSYLSVSYHRTTNIYWKFLMFFNALCNTFTRRRLSPKPALDSGRCVWDRKEKRGKKKGLPPAPERHGRQPKKRRFYPGLQDGAL